MATAPFSTILCHFSLVHMLFVYPPFDKCFIPFSIQFLLFYCPQKLCICPEISGNSSKLRCRVHILSRVSSVSKFFFSVLRLFFLCAFRSISHQPNWYDARPPEVYFHWFILLCCSFRCFQFTKEKRMPKKE